MELLDTNTTAHDATTAVDATTALRDATYPVSRPAPTGPPPAPAGREPAATPPRRRPSWQALGGAVAAVAVCGALLGYGLTQRSSAADWRDRADTTSRELETAQGDLTAAREQVTAAQTARDTALGDATTVRSDLTRITSQRDQMRTQLVGAESLFDSMAACTNGHDKVIVALLDAVSGTGSQAAFNAAVDEHNATCAAASALASQWHAAVSALGI